VNPNPSIAPDLISTSSTLRFTFRVSSRWRKSRKSLNGSFSRASMIVWIAASPIPLIPQNPYRIARRSSGGTSKPSIERFRSGGRIFSPAFRQSPM